MDRGSPFGFGDLPEDPDDSADEDPLAGQPLAFRGWIPPEDRLWRHPSELAGLGEIPDPGASGDRDRSRPERSPADRFRSDRARADRRAVAPVAVAGAVFVAVAVITLVLADGMPGAHQDRADRVSVSAAAAKVTDSTMVMVPAAAVVKMIAALRPSLVELVTVSGRHRRVGTGVALPGGDLVLTAATAVSGTARVEAVTASGRRYRARVVGSDPRSGVAVVDVDDGDGLTPAPFADETVSAGQLAVAACLCRSGTAPNAALAKVTDVGTAAVEGSRPHLVDAILANAPLSADARGGVLLDADGQVIGILDTQTSSGSSTVGVFVPTPVAMGTAAQLAAGHPVVHGWLGVSATDQAGGCGAQIVQVMAGSPAQASGLRPGDVIDAVDGHQVCSLADLQGRLYVLAPEQRVELGVVTAAGATTMPATLAASVSAAG